MAYRSFDRPRIKARRDGSAAPALIAALGFAALFMGAVYGDHVHRVQVMAHGEVVR